MEKYIKSFGFYEKVITTYNAGRPQNKRNGKEVYYWAIQGIIEVALNDKNISFEEYRRLRRMAERITG